MNSSRDTVCIMRNSPCCGVVVWRLNKRRRQCSLCRKTWTIRPRRRGRKQKRQQPRFSYRVLTERRSLRSFARNGYLGREKIRRRFHRSLDRLTRSSPESLIPTGPLIAVVDAIHANCEGLDVMIPIILIRSLYKEEAIVAVLDVRIGGESEFNWSQAFEILKPEIKSRIMALVSDDCLGLVRYARSQNWIIQLCNFHLKARFRVILGRKQRVAFREERHLAWQLVQLVASENNSFKIGFYLRLLKRLGQRQDIPKQLRIHVNGFLRNWKDYRTYLEYPKLNLPNTTNSVEAIASIIRRMLRERYGFKTIKSLKRWLKTVQILNPKVACKRAKILQN